MHLNHVEMKILFALSMIETLLITKLKNLKKKICIKNIYAKQNDTKYVNFHDYTMKKLNVFEF